MIPTPVPATPTGNHVEADAGNRPSAVPGGFDAALQQTRPAAAAPAATHGAAAHDGAAPSGATAARDDATGDRGGKPKHSKDDRDPAAPIAHPAVAADARPAAPPAPAPPARQAPAASGKPLPTDVRPDPTQVAAAQAPAASAAIAARPAFSTPRSRAAVAAGADAAGVRQPPATKADATDGPNTPDGTDGTHATPTATATAAAMPIALVLDAATRKNNAGDATRIDAGHAVGPFIQLAQIHGATANAGPAPAQLAMQSAPGQPQFAQEITQHVAWLVGNQLQQARIELNPRALGPIRIDVTTHHDRVDVQFAVQHPQTVQALQQTLPQLGDMLAQHGLNLGQASVGQQAPGQQHPSPASQPGSRWRDADVAVPAGTGAMGRVRIGAVDEFA